MPGAFDLHTRRVNTPRNRDLPSHFYTRQALLGSPVSR